MATQAGPALKILSQWRGYCEIGNGYSLGFNGAKLKQQASKQAGYSLAPCVYEEKIDLLQKSV